MQEMQISIFCTSFWPCIISINVPFQSLYVDSDTVNKCIIVQTLCKLKDLLDKVEDLETTNDVLKQRLVSWIIAAIAQTSVMIFI